MKKIGRFYSDTDIIFFFIIWTPIWLHTEHALFSSCSSRCYNCGGPDHHAKECQLPPQPKKCHFCQSTSHMVANCPIRSQQSLPGSQGKSSTAGERSHAPLSPEASDWEGGVKMVAGGGATQAPEFQWMLLLELPQVLVFFFFFYQQHEWMSLLVAQRCI